MVKKGTDMKKNAVLFFFKSLLKSILVIVSILAVGVISYKVSYQYLSKQLEAGKLDVQEKELESILDQAKTDEISKNLIYVVNDKQMITHMMLEICNTKTNNMDYITIPINADYTIPAKMYQKLCVVDEEIPQIVRLSKLRRYFSDLEDAEAYGYAELIMEKLLKTDISYFTVISQEIYDLHYQEQKMTTQYAKVLDGSGQSASASPSPGEQAQQYNSSVTMKVMVLSDSFTNQLKDIAGDETKIMGGIGICGRALCCNTYLSEFAPVSIKMAKEQNLSLNPTKISGVCGRLMCCLKNEEETYEYLNSRLPGIGDRVTTVDGLKGEVSSVNVLRQMVKVLVEVDDEKELREYPVDELKFRPRRRKENIKLSAKELKELSALEDKGGKSKIDDTK